MGESIEPTTTLPGPPEDEREPSPVTDDPEGFAVFYRMLFRRDIPMHAYSWVCRLYEARAQGKGFIIEAFRGSSKTTSITIAFLAFRIGLFPLQSNLVLQANAIAARATCRQVADLIAHNPGWRVAFPHIVPDKKAGWSMAHGYEVMRTDMAYELWRQLCAETKGRDPTFVGLGYRSSYVVGLHPTGMLLADDIHNETNTRSLKEMDKAVAILTSNILPTLNPDTWTIFIGTPWRQGDVLQYLKATQTYASVSTPIYTELPHEQGGLQAAPTDGPDVGAHCNAPNSAAGGTTIAPLEESPPLEITPPESQIENRNSKIENSFDFELTWPERFPLHVIQNYRLMLGEREFARMYLLDLSAAEGLDLKAEWLHKVDASAVNPAWPVVMGVDYASTADKQRNNDRDYFAIAIGRAQPKGSGIILIDGFRGHLSQAEAEAKLLELVAFYPNTEAIGVESVGKGEEFYHLLSSHASLPIVEMNPGGQGKGPRFQNAMAPLFQRGWARISDIESPFMQTFRREWLRWPWGDHDDTLDAVYWMLRVGQYHLRPRPEKSPSPSPFSALGRK